MKIKPNNRIDEVASILSLALIRRKNRYKSHLSEPVDDDLTLLRTRAFIGSNNQRGGKNKSDGHSENIATIIAANNRD